jgi:RND superfamily putative drug exporter
MAFIVLVAVGADYNMLLISRIRDESPDGMRSGVIRTIRSTGVIASAGMIFAVPMLALLFSRIGSIVQGELVAVGLATKTKLVTLPDAGAATSTANANANANESKPPRIRRPFPMPSTM